MFIRKPILLALAAVASMQTFAKGPAEPVRLGASLRVGFAPSVDDKLSHGGFGLGLNSEFQLSEKVSLVGELGYWANTGRQYIAPFQPTAAGRTVALNPVYSVDTRKNSLSSLHLRGLCRYDFGAKTSVQGGLQVGKSRFRHEYIGQYANNNLATATAANTGTNFRDTCNATPTESALKVSPIVGMQYAFDKDSSFELNLVGLSYSAIDFRHTPGAPLVSGSLTNAGSTLVYAGDTLVKSNRMTLTVELGYTFRF